MSTRAVRAELAKRLTGSLEAEGYTEAVRGDRHARARALETPLTVQVSPVIEGHRYGGASLAASVTVVSEPVQEFMGENVPHSALTRTPREGEKLGFFLDLTSSGQLLTQGRNLDLQWQVEDESAVGGAVSEFADFLRGPLQEWVQARSTVDGLLAQRLADPRPVGYSGRSCAVLALQLGRRDTAESYIRAMASSPGLSPDQLRRLSAFQNTLLEHFPNYRPVQLPTVEE